jgi:predicted transglutaminase-like cysteine proteinase
MGKYNFVENLFCGRPISDGETLTQDLAASRMSEVRIKTQLADATSQLNVAKAQYASCMDNTSSTTGQLKAQISQLIADEASMQAQLKQAQDTVAAISSSLDGKNNLSLLSTSTQALALMYYDKYPEAFVTYGGRVWGVGRSKYNLDVKAWCLEGQNDQAVNALLNECRGKISMVLQDNPTITFHEACDIAVMRIKAKTDGMVQYAFDSQTWGIDEFWQFASETIAGKLGDCEDKAILHFVACRAAGIPRELVRVTAGMTFSGEGHCTFFYLASDLKFHHINSTTNYPASKDVKLLPLPGDSSESLNIQHVWFSSTDDKTFNWFTTEANAAKDQMKNDGFLKWLKFNAKKR